MSLLTELMFKLERRTFWILQPFEIEWNSVRGLQFVREWSDIQTRVTFPGDRIVFWSGKLYLMENDVEDLAQAWLVIHGGDPRRTVEGWAQLGYVIESKL